MEHSMKRRTLLHTALATLICATMAVGAHAQYTKLVDFNRANGDSPRAPLIQGLDGNFYGTAIAGGTRRAGTAFSITSTGTLTTLRNFCVGPQLTCSKLGAGPYAPLIQTNDGTFYTPLFTSGLPTPANAGSIVRIFPNGVATKVADICPQSPCAYGASPVSGLTQGIDGNFYGTTSAGGNLSNQCVYSAFPGCGAIYKATRDGTLTSLHTFCALSNCTDGAVPNSALVQGTDGNFYGTTSGGGAHKFGTVFKLTPAGTFEVLHSFCSVANCADGGSPNGLMQANDGYFYGTTQSDSASSGTVFRISPTGVFATLYSFCPQPGCADGLNPTGTLIQGTDGRLYGVTVVGGVFGKGTIFRVTRSGTLTRIFSFAHLKGTAPLAGLVQGTDGNLYGTASAGGIDNRGVAFTFSAGMGPFVEATRPYGVVGTNIVILGNALTGSTSVSFNGTLATFTVVSDTEITATVPTGATTGRIQVVTPGGTLTSNVAFRVF